MFRSHLVIKIMFEVTHTSCDYRSRASSSSDQLGTIWMVLWVGTQGDEAFLGYLKSLCRLLVELKSEIFFVLTEEHHRFHSRQH